MTTAVYEGTKIVQATPMNRLEYNQYRGWDLPADENGADEGYLVEYLDGGKGNHRDHLGYISWSPKEVFERAYKISPVDMHFKNQPPHVQRMLKEWLNLNDSYRKGQAFVDQEKNPKTRKTNISIEDWTLLRDQLQHMLGHLSILTSRINRAGISTQEMKDKLILTQ